jgi:hypothetical protein
MEWPLLSRLTSICCIRRLISSNVEDRSSLLLSPIALGNGILAAALGRVVAVALALVLILVLAPALALVLVLALALALALIPEPLILERAVAVGVANCPGPCPCPCVFPPIPSRAALPPCPKRFIVGFIFSVFSASYTEADLRGTGDWEGWESPPAVVISFLFFELLLQVDAGRSGEVRGVMVGLRCGCCWLVAV